MPVTFTIVDWYELRRRKGWATNNLRFFNLLEEDLVVIFLQLSIMKQEEIPSSRNSLPDASIPRRVKFFPLSANNVGLAVY